MVLKKNYGALFFLFLWGAVFSQKEQLKKTNKLFENQTYSESGKSYLKTIAEVDNVSQIRVSNSYYFSHKSAKKIFQNKAADVILSNHKQGFKNEEIRNQIGYVSFLDDKSPSFAIDYLSINSEYSDYAPSYYDGELVFASSRTATGIVKTIQELNNQPFLDLYTTSKNNHGKNIVRLKGSINSIFHESSAAFSKDKKTVYFTRNNYISKKSGKNTEATVLLKICKATYKKGRWTNIEELPFSSDEYSIAHPALSPDGRFLYFCSDMPGSFGKSDLYVVEINEDGSFGHPKNLGGNINTSGRETFPYISDKGKLFFASDGHPGLGGLDIFMTIPDNDGSGMKTYNLGVPINSVSDDFTFIINEEDKSGYFASNRAGGKGDDDIYGFKQLVAFPSTIKDNLKPHKVIKKIERIIELKPHKESTTSL